MPALLLFAGLFFTATSLSAQLQVTVSTTTTEVYSGQIITYNFLYTCASITTPCPDVTMTGTLSGANGTITAVATTPDVSSYNVVGNVVTFNFVNPLPAGSTGIIEVTVQTHHGSNLNNSNLMMSGVILSGGVPQGNSSVSTPVKAYDKMCPEKYNPVATPLDGVTLYYINLTHPKGSNSTYGTLNPTNTTVVDQLPAGAIFEPTQSTPGYVYNSMANTVTYNIADADLALNACCGTTYAKTYQIAIAVRYNSPTFTAGDVVNNTATVTYTPLGESPKTVVTGSTSSWTEPDGSTGTCTVDLTATSTVEAPNPAALLSKYANKGTYASGEGGYYGMNFDNNGNVTLQNVVIEDVIPTSGIHVTSINSGAWQGNNTGMTLSVQIKTVSNPTYTQVLIVPNPNYLSYTYTVPSGEEVTHIRWIFDQVNPGFKGYYAGATSTLVSFTTLPVSSPTVFTNCYTISTSTPGFMSTGTSCANITVDVPWPYSLLNLSKDFWTSPPISCYANWYQGPIPIGATVYTAIRLDNIAGGLPLQDPVIADLLPFGVDYDGEAISFGTWCDAVPIPPVAPVVTVIPNYLGTGRTMVRMAFPGYSMPAGISHVVLIKTKLTSNVPAGPPVGDYFAVNDGTGLKNIAYVSGSSPTVCQYPAETETTDIYDADGDGSFTDKVCYTKDGASVTSSAALESIKWVKGSCDADYSKYPQFGQTFPGGLANYKASIENTGNVAVDEIVMIDILPFVGDHGVIDPNPRNTRWRPVLAGPVNAPPGVTVLYSTVSNPCRTELVPSGPAGCTAPNWSNTPPADITTVQSLKFDFGSMILYPGDLLNFTWDMRAPIDVPATLYDSIAWNSFGYKATRVDNNVAFLPAEPLKVGIKLKPLQPGIYGNRVWLDNDHAGDQEAGEPGVNGVKVDLYRDNGDNVADPKTDEFVSFTTTSGDGKYLFPALSPDNYFAVVHLPPTYQMSPANAGADDIDSDGSFLLCNGERVAVFPVTNIAAAEADSTWDQGIYPSGLAALGNYVWRDRNSNNTQDEAASDGVNGVRVCLYRDVNTNGMPEPNAADGPPVALDTTTNDPFGKPGYYLFDMLQPGDYFVEFKLNNGQTFTPSTGSANGSSDPSDSDPATSGLTEVTSLSANETDLTWDAGIILPTGPYELGNYVWIDTDNDGLADPGEIGINGVTVNLYLDADNDNKPDAGEFVATTTTGVVGGTDGVYYFEELPAGNYIVQIPPGALTTPPLVGYTSSTGNDPAPDPDDNIENDDNGALVSGCGVISKPITLGPGNSEPLNGGIRNYSVDFGFQSCTVPSGIAFTQTAATCSGSTPNNNGTISLSTVTEGTNYGLSTLNAGSYDGPSYPATAIPGTLPAVIKSGVPNTGGTYIVRIFNGSADCYIDVPVVVAPVTCNCAPIPCGTTTVIKN